MCDDPLVALGGFHIRNGSQMATNRPSSRGAVRPWILTTPNYGAHLAACRKLEIPHGITQELHQDGDCQCMLML